MNRDISTCSRGACRNLAVHYCAACKRAFCEACWPVHQDYVHKDEALESEVLSLCIKELSRLKSVGARRVLKLIAKQMGLRYLPGAGRIR